MKFQDNVQIDILNYDRKGVKNKLDERLRSYLQFWSFRTDIYKQKDFLTSNSHNANSKKFFKYFITLHQFSEFFE